MTSPDSEVASKATDRQRPKKGKMTDEEIMDKLSTSLYMYFFVQFYFFVRLKPVLCSFSDRNHRQYWRSKKEIHTIREDRTRVGLTILHNMFMLMDEDL